MNTLTRNQEPRTPGLPSPAPSGVPSGTQRPWYHDLLCKCGIHRGKWVYLAEGACKQMRVCHRCGRVDQRIKHVRKWEYIRDGRCEQTKACSRCRDSGNMRTRHVWGPTYSSGGRSSHQCERCRREETWSTSSEY